MHVNKINFKKYIGQSIYDWGEIKKRFGNSGEGYKGQTFGKAIKKYGWDNFYHICLYDNLSAKELDWVEEFCIKHYKTLISEEGYNLSKNGRGYTLDEVVRKKISKSVSEYQQQDFVKWYNSEIHKKENLSESTRKKLSESKKGEKHHYFGKHLSDDTKSKMSESRKGIVHSVEWNDKISKSKKGKLFTDEHKRKLSEARKKIKVSEETKKKHQKTYVVSQDDFKSYVLCSGMNSVKELTGLGIGSISSIISGDTNSKKGYKIIHEEDLSAMFQGEISYEEIQNRQRSNKKRQGLKGKSLSDLHKKNISKAKLENSKAPYIRATNVITGQSFTFKGVQNAIKELGLKSDIPVYYILKGKKKSPYLGWVFEYI